MPHLGAACEMQAAGVPSATVARIGAIRSQLPIAEPGRASARWPAALQEPVLDRASVSRSVCATIGDQAAYSRHDARADCRGLAGMRNRRTHAWSVRRTGWPGDRTRSQRSGTRSRTRGQVLRGQTHEHADIGRPFQGLDKARRPDPSTAPSTLGASASGCRRGRFVRDMGCARRLARRARPTCAIGAIGRARSPNAPRRQAVVSGSLGELALPVAR